MRLIQASESLKGDPGQAQRLQTRLLPHTDEVNQQARDRVDQLQNGHWFLFSFFIS